MTEHETPPGEIRARLEPIPDTDPLLPFARASALTDISLYWMSIPSYPMANADRAWLLEFLSRLTLVLSRQSLRTETFILFKTLYPDLLDRFIKASSRYSPMTGISLQPGVPPPELPTMEDVEAEVKKGGKIDVNKWMADYCFWFLNKQGEEQRQEFLGYGGMLFLFLKPDPATKPPEIKVPKAVRTHPAFKDQDFEGKLASAFSVKEGFLAKSKEVFGEPLRSEAAYPGIPFVAPLFRAEDLLEAPPELREQWFQVFDGYCLESKFDKGLLLALKDPAFDETLIPLLNSMRDSGWNYPQ